MIKDVITETAICSGRLNKIDFLNKVDMNTDITGDVTFNSTLRCLLLDRVGDDCFLGRYQRIYVVEKDVPEYVRQFLVQSQLTDLQFIEASLDGFSSDVFNKVLEEKLEGWERVLSITAFYSRLFNVSCFINRETRRSILLLYDRLTIARWHFLQSCMPAMMPWFFKEHPASPDEKAMLQSLAGDYKEVYLDLVYKIANEKYNLRKLYVDAALTGYGKKRFESSISNAEAELKDQMKRMDELIEELEDCNRRRNEAIDRINGLKLLAESSEGNDTRDFFLSNDSLVLEYVSEYSIKFGVKTYALDYDPDVLETVMKQRNSWFQCATENVQKLMDLVFIQERARMKMCGAFTFNGSGVSIATDRMRDVEYRDYMPNPHLFEFKCFGDNLPLIQACLRDGDEIGALSQTITAAGNLNFNDTAVMSRFELDLNKVFDSVRCIDYNGESMTPAEFLRRVSDEEN